jgi:TRAP transporter TAXI family solute receptor
MPDGDARPRHVGSSLPVTAIVAAGVSLLVLVGGFSLWRSFRQVRERRVLVLATGPESGTYHALGQALGRLIEAERLAARVDVRATEGSGENMGLLASGVADLAIVQSDSRPVESIRLIGTLFDEAMHILVAPEAAGSVSRIGDLDGRRVSLGGATSGTRQVAERVLAHFEVTPAEDLALEPAEALDGLREGRLDAVFLLTAVPSRVVAELARDDGARFLSLGEAQEVGGEADALALVFPQLHATTVPRGTYARLPAAPVRTVGVRAQLVGTGDLANDFVYRLIATLLAKRSRLDDPANEFLFADRFRESYAPETTRLPYHPGATAYYERARPSFIVEYAEPLSLGFTMVVGFWSASLALRQWIRRRRKNRVDRYYIEVVKGAPNLAVASADELVARRERLVEVRERAFTDLVAERLEADESFVILQNHIDSELASIQRRLARTAQPD